MTADPQPPIQPEELEAYLLGQLGDDRVEQLDRALREDAVLRRQLATSMQVMSLVRQEFAGREQRDATHRAQPLLQDFNTLLNDLAEQEAGAQPIKIGSDDEAEHGMDVSRQDLAEAADYLFRYLAASKPARWSAAAAAVLIAATLFFALWGGGDRTTPVPLVEGGDHTTPVPVVEDDSQPTYVATLTASLDAEWASAPLSNGDRLQAKQRLRLTSGFAKITTDRGAVAVLEAPATVELINHNAIRLHTGKLVGICETESSKGFVVRTLHTDVTYLGTRLGVGVDASKGGRTQVHVIEGSVELSTPAPGGEQQQKLEMGESVVADGRGRPQPIDFAPNQFVTHREFAVREDAHQSDWARSMVHRYERARAGGVLLDLVFGEDKSGQAHVRSVVPQTGPLVANVEHLTRGRFGERTAVRFSDDSHCVQVVLDQPMQAVTIAGWYSIDRFEHLFTSMFHSTYTGRQGGMGNLHWHIRRYDDGTAAIGLYQHRGGKMEDSDAWSELLPQDLLINKWVHLAMTLDTTSGEAALYLDGQQLASHKKDDWLPIVLGEIQVGNWQIHGAPPVGSDGVPRSLHGAVDGFVVFDRSLTAEEISELYRSEFP